MGAIAALSIGTFLYAQEGEESENALAYSGFNLDKAIWYESDVSGLARRTVAASSGRRLPWALAVVKISSEEMIGFYGLGLDDILRAGGWGEYRSLMAEGVEKRATVVLLDKHGRERFIERRDNNGLSRREYYNEDSALTEERSLEADGTIRLIKYSYDQGLVIKAEGFVVERDAEGLEKMIPEWVESFKYDRNLSIRSATRSLIAQTNTPPSSSDKGAAVEDSENQDAISVPMPKLDQQKENLAAMDLPLPTIKLNEDEKPIEKAGDAEQTVELGQWDKAPNQDAMDSINLVQMEQILELERIMVLETELGVPRLLETKSTEENARVTRYDELGRPIELRRISPEGGVIGTPTVIEYFSDSELPAPSVSLSMDKTSGETVRVEYNAEGQITSIQESVNDTVLSETAQDWSENRIKSVVTNIGGDSLRTEYEYDSSGSRIAEKNYRNEILERHKYTSGDIEIEDLYREGRVLIRALWKDGQKMDEYAPALAKTLSDTGAMSEAQQTNPSEPDNE